MRIESTTDYGTAFRRNILPTVRRDYSFRNATIAEVMDRLVEETNLAWTRSGDIVTLSVKPANSGQQRMAAIKGTVRDAQGRPIAGATVMVKGTTTGTATDTEGTFSLNAQAAGTTLRISFLGKRPAEIQYNGQSQLIITLEDDVVEMEDVVVTGIYERPKESFTGSSQTYKTEELKMVGTQNLIQSLKTLDPSFNVIENNQYGSDPNRTPDIEIRGKTSIVGFKEQFGEDPNQPLFILDGFETTLSAIMDLSLDRVASVTLLKDAASTAIYGAKAANGVVVIETVMPKQGRLILSYNGSFDISFADLTQYNLMNAAEKLEFEMLSGSFQSNLPKNTEDRMIRYNHLMRNVLRGVDTYWMSEPLRTAFNQRHNIYLQGGDNQMRYGVSLNLSDVNGVMKKSKRQVMSGAVDLLYRYGKLSFTNKLTVDYNKTDNPVVAFSMYSRANPYYPKHNDVGGIDKWLEKASDFNGAGQNVPNPLWDDSRNSYKRGSSWGFRESLNVEYRPFTFLMARGRFGMSMTTSENEDFTSPEDSSFDMADLLKKGSYSNSRSDSFSYDGDMTVTYGQLLADAHQINAVIGASMRESSSDSKQFSALGFPDGDFTTPAFSNQYPDNSKPRYSDYKKRNVSFFFNGGYSYKNRYLLDANIRADGSSVFGSNRRFTATWAVGVGWNLHSEKFIADNTDLFQMLKIRASIGNPGNQNFGSFNTITTYRFNNWLLNSFGTGILIDAFGDPDLEWQKTLDRNIGFDLSMLNNRLHVTFDYYHKLTDPLLAYIGMAISTGTANRLTNIGRQVDKGFSGTLKYSPIYRPQDRINWTTSLNFRHGTAYYDKIGDRLSQINSENRSKNLARYYDGASPTSLWSVVSAGIDPASGRELFITAGGRKTFSYNFDDEIEVGDTRPMLEGVFGNALYWKGFSLNISIRYCFGGDAFNQTLFNKVENISHSELSKNQDRRALYNRWKEPGDQARFRGISLTDVTRISSRFVQPNDYISIESVRVGYEFNRKWMEKIGFSGMNVSAYMNEIYRFSTLGDERGIDYPFARSFTFALSVNF